MISKKTPWDEISQPSTDYNRRLVSVSTKVPLSWGKDVAGRCLFIMELIGDHHEQFRCNHTTVCGIQVDLQQFPSTDKQNLVLALERSVDRDIFHGLCQTLIESLSAARDSSSALAIALNHIKRWKAFLAGRRSRLLTPEEVRGLFAELEFLNILNKEHLKDKNAVEAWCGAEKVHQDFVFGDTAVEVKSISGRERNSILISSEDQLETVCNNLFLAVIRLGKLPDMVADGLSLNDQVARIAGQFSDPSAANLYWEKVAAYGYVKVPDYDMPCYAVLRQRMYRVDDSFPRLVRSQLPEGIARLHYDIELEKIEAYECDKANIWENSE